MRRWQHRGHPGWRWPHAARPGRAPAALAALLTLAGLRRLGLLLLLGATSPASAGEALEPWGRVWEGPALVDRAGLDDLATRLHDPVDRPPVWIASDPADRQALARFVAGLPADPRPTVVAEAPEATAGRCVLSVARDAALQWALQALPESRCLRRGSEREAIAWVFGGSVGLAGGNRGLGPLVEVGAHRWTERQLGIGGRLWGVGETLRGSRVAGGIEAALGVAGGPGLVELTAGIGATREQREVCAPDCTLEVRGPLVGPTLGGLIATRVWTGSGWDRRVWTGGIRVRSVPGRGFVAALIVGLHQGRREVGPRPDWARHDVASAAPSAP